MSWWWEYFDEKGLKPYFKNVRKIHDMMLEKGQGSYEDGEAECSSGDIQCYPLICGKTHFVYIFNPTNDVINTSVSVRNVTLKKPTVTIYYCEDGSMMNYGHRKTGKDSLMLDKINVNTRMDMVLIIN